MNRDKQIEEMAKAICHAPTCEIRKNGGTCYKYCKAYIYAFRAVNAGYRKDSDIIDEFVERLRQKAHTMSCYNAHYKGDFDAVDIDDVHQIAKEIENED